MYILMIRHFILTLQILLITEVTDNFAAHPLSNTLLLGLSRDSARVVSGFVPFTPLSKSYFQKAYFVVRHRYNPFTYACYINKPVPGTHTTTNEMNVVGVCCSKCERTVNNFLLTLGVAVSVVKLDYQIPKDLICLNL